MALKRSKMQTDSFVASSSSPTPDFELQNHGSIFLLIPQTISARIWIADHISREGREVISGQGSFDVQVCGPESLRLTGHCLYLTLDQLKRFKQAVPEPFERSRN